MIFRKKILTKLRLYGIISHVVSAPGRVLKIYPFFRVSPCYGRDWSEEE